MDKADALIVVQFWEILRWHYAK